MPDDTPFLDLTKGGASEPLPSNFMPFWGDDPDSWNTVVIARKRVPGLSVVDGKGFDNRIDRQKVPGTNGLRLVHIGTDPADFVIKTKLWTADQLGEYIDIVKLVKPQRKGQTPVPVEITHPALTLWGVSACLVLSGGIPKGNKEESPDYFVVELRCIEFVPQSKQKATVKAASYDVSNLGPGAVAEKIAQQKAQQSPAAQNRSPNASYPDQNASFPKANASGPGGG